MSRRLPDHPNLEHLKNQAKDRLRDLQSQNRGSKLSDAQHAIAREYGCVNWSELKARVEAVASRSGRARGGGGGSGGGGAVVMS